MQGPHHHVLRVVHRARARVGQSLLTGQPEVAVHFLIGIYLQSEFRGFPNIPLRVAARSNPQPDWPAAARLSPGVLNSLVNPLFSVVVRTVCHT